MNALPKVVFSRTLDTASWHNTTLVKGELAAEVRRLKCDSGSDMAILGSGTIVSQLAPHGLIDEFQLVVNPVVLGQGRTLFEGIQKKLSLRLTRSAPSATGMSCCVTNRGETLMPPDVRFSATAGESITFRLP